MNLLVSYDWLKEYVGAKLSPEDFARQLSLSGPSVERIHRQGEGLKNIVVGKILKVKPHPNADKLRIVETDLGTMTKDIVCGGSNLEEGQSVVVALPGSWVKWHGEGEPVEIKAAKLRGADSYGMICGADEVGLLDRFPKKDEKEIVDVTSMGIAPGTPLADALGIGGVVFDVEVTTNRPDAFSMVGMAREAAAIIGADFLWKPAPAVSPAKAGVQKAASFSVEIKSALCQRYMAVAMTGAKNAETPKWMKDRLAAAGHSSISPLVDITNYVMLELGQPMHVFDRAKLSGDEIVVREAKDGETMKALDGKSYAFKSGQLVIADAQKPVAVAGVMGGEETGVSAETTEIVFEAATFDAVHVRRTARALNLHSDSSLRFEKGLSTEALPAALARAVQLAEEICGAKVSSAVVDERAHPYKKISYAFRPDRANELIGVKIPAAVQKKTLLALGFKVTGTGKSWKVEVPFWRDMDIEGERDLVEEVARVYGYDNLPSVIPAGALPLAEVSKELAWEDMVKRFLKQWGFTELMTYSFISKALIEKIDGDPKSYLRILNPLSEDFEYMRLGLMQSVLDAIAQNQEERGEGKAFELANGYVPREGDLPAESPRLLITSWSRDQKGGDVRKIIGAVEALMSELGIRNLRIEQGACPLFHPGRSARMRVGDRELGYVGEIHPTTLKKFGIERRVAAATFDFAGLLAWASTAKVYTPIPQFPPVKRDIAFVVDHHRTHAEIVKKLKNADPMVAHVELFDIFEDAAKLGEGKKSVAYHLIFASKERTLTAEEVDAAMDRIRAMLKSEFGGEAR